MYISKIEKKILQLLEFTKPYFYRYCEKTLEYAITSERDSDDPMWLCCIPVYHFLKGTCNPFDDLPNIYSHNAEKPIWWGKGGIHVSMDNLKGKTRWKRYNQIDANSSVPGSIVLILQTAVLFLISFAA